MQGIWGWAGFGGGILAFGLVHGLLVATGRSERRPVDRLPAIGQLARAVAILAVVSFIEELVFRAGFVGLGRRLVGIPAALAASTVAFGWSHVFNGRGTRWVPVNLGLVGVALGLVYLRWGLWAAAGAHAGWNLTQWGLGYAVSGERTRALLPSGQSREVKGVPYGPEGDWTAAVVLAGVLGLLAHGYGAAAGLGR